MLTQDPAGLKSALKGSRLWQQQRLEARRASADQNPSGAPVERPMSAPASESTSRADWRDAPAPAPTRDVQYELADGSYVLGVTTRPGEGYPAAPKPADERPVAGPRTGWSDAEPDTSSSRQVGFRDSAPVRMRPPSPQTGPVRATSTAVRQQTPARPRSAQPDPAADLYTTEVLSASFDRGSGRMPSRGAPSSSGPVRATVDLSGSVRRAPPGSAPGPSSYGARGLSTSFSDAALGGDLYYGGPAGVGAGSGGPGAMARRKPSGPHQRRGATPPRRSTGSTSTPTAGGGGSAAPSGATSYTLNASYDGSLSASRRVATSSSAGSGYLTGTGSTSTSYRAPSPMPERASSSAAGPVRSTAPKRSVTPQARPSITSTTSTSSLLSRSGSGASITGGAGGGPALLGQSSAPKPRVRPPSPMGRVSSTGTQPVSAALPVRSQSAKRSATQPASSSYSYGAPYGGSSYAYSSSLASKNRWAL